MTFTERNLVKCQKCNRQVDEAQVIHDVILLRHTIVAFCHGESEKMEITQDIAVNGAHLDIPMFFQGGMPDEQH